MKEIVYDKYVSKKADKIKHNPLKHYMNNDEAKQLRKIMSKTGLSEEEVRLHTKYRKQLSKAQSDGEKRKRSGVKKWMQNRIKEACKITCLVPQHPETIKVLDEILDDYYNGRWWCYRPWGVKKIDAKTVVENYSKK